MDKENLYYITVEGTDCCIVDKVGNPIMFLPTFVDTFLNKANSPFAKETFVKISVEEYERTFTEMLEY